MYCHNCGNKLSDDALFCNQCGARQQHQEQTTAGTYSTPAPNQDYPGAYYQQPGQSAPPNRRGAPGSYAPPPKNNTAKILLLSLGGLVVITAVALILVFKPFSAVRDGNTTASIVNQAATNVEDNLDVFIPGDNENVQGAPDDTAGDFGTNDAGTDIETTDNNTEPDTQSGSNVPSPGPEANSTQELTMFDVPAWSQDPIYTVIDAGGVWTSVGLAGNPNQVNGPDGEFSLADYEDCIYYTEFFADLTWKIKYDEAGYVSVDTAYYEIMDLDYADVYDYDDSYGFRFYNGSDGRLYMCFYLIDDDSYPDASDFVVFEKKGDAVNWAQSD